MKREYFCVFSKFFLKKLYMNIDFFFSWNKEENIFSWNTLFPIIFCCNSFNIILPWIKIFRYWVGPSWDIYNRDIRRYMTIIVLKNLWVKRRGHDNYFYIFSVFHKHCQYLRWNTESMYLIQHKDIGNNIRICHSS